MIRDNEQGAMRTAMNFKIALIVSFVGCLAFAQDDAKVKQKALTESKNLTWEGNKQLSEDKFVDAEIDYRRAIAKSDENAAARYNLGNAYYNNETYSEAFGRFKQAGELATDKSEKHGAYHNMGNVFMKRKEYQKAVEAYKEALRNDPTDEETRYNLALAKELLKKEQDENDQNQDNKDENEDKQDQKDENEDKKEGDNEDESENKDEKDEGDKGDEGNENEEQKDENKEGEGDEKKEQEKKPEQGDQDEQKQPQQRRPDQLSKQQVQNLLEAMQNEEKKVQEKMDAQKVKGVKVKNEKDW